MAREASAGENGRSVNPIIRALETVTQWLETHRVRYMLIGGMAAGLYGDPRQTFDIDIKMHLQNDLPLDRFLSMLTGIAVLLPDEPESFVSETRVLPVEVGGVRVDLVFADLPWEMEAMERSRNMTVFGFEIRVCTPEDLIIQKSVSTRDRDWMDIAGLIERKSGELDWDYLLKHCRDLAAFLDRPSLVERIERYRKG